MVQKAGIRNMLKRKTWTQEMRFQTHILFCQQLFYLKEKWGAAKTSSFLKESKRFVVDDRRTNVAGGISQGRRRRGWRKPVKRETCRHTRDDS